MEIDSTRIDNCSLVTGERPTIRNLSVGDRPYQKEPDANPAVLSAIPLARGKMAQLVEEDAHYEDRRYKSSHAAAQGEVIGFGESALRDEQGVRDYDEHNKPKGRAPRVKVR